MALVLSAPKVVLLAAELAAKADVDGLATLAVQHDAVLRKELLLRILLSYLPANIGTDDYISLLREIDAGDFTQLSTDRVDASRVNLLTDDDASKRVRKLRLRQLSWPGAPEDLLDDSLGLFLLQRAYSVDEGGGSLSELPALLTPFIDRSPSIRTWVISTLLPLLRRNVEYYPDSPIPHDLRGFESLPGPQAVRLLLSRTGSQAQDQAPVGRDLRGLIGPWLYNDNHWITRTGPPANGGATSALDQTGNKSLCPGWEQVLQWLSGQAAKNWRVAVNAVEEWEGPSDVDLGGFGTMWFNDLEQEYLEQRYARAALAAAYLIPEASEESLTGAHSIVTKIAGLLDQDPSPPLTIAISILPPVPEFQHPSILSAQSATHLRNDLLHESNVLTAPSRDATVLLQALVLSAVLVSRMGSSCTVRRAGELVLLQDEREQKAEAIRLIRGISDNGPKTDDKYWMKSLDELLWLRDWGAEEAAGGSHEKRGRGPLGRVKREVIEVEMLKALLTNSREFGPLGCTVATIDG
jgi:protein transport protein SEC39